MLKISDNKRFIQKDDNTPFFFLGDTAWDLFNRLDREEADYYLRRRAEQGFTVIEAVALSHEATRNTFGEAAILNNDPSQPNEAFFKHVDYIVAKAEEYGLYIGMLPTWGSNVVKAEWHKSAKEIFTPENAFTYGKFIGNRYAGNKIIWILGGDRVPAEEHHYAAYRAMAKGIKEGDNGANLMTYHPCGPYTSAEFFHNDDWLDFNTLQTGHAYNTANYERIERDYNLIPVKPCMDGEPGYENIPSGRNINGDATGLNPENGYLTCYDARKFAYWAVFAGAHGHTYGCNEVFQFYDAAQVPPYFHARIDWREAMELPGGNQMIHLRKLIESRPYFSRIPDQSLLVSIADEAAEHRQATRSLDGSYAMVYSPTGKQFDMDLSSLSGEIINVWWFNPRNGESEKCASIKKSKKTLFTPPSSGDDEDWVLVLDDASRSFGVPGSNQL